MINENNDDLDNQYNNGVDMYYKLKNIYKQTLKKGINELKKAMIGTDKYIKKTRVRFIPKCINCERRVGTFFYNSYNQELDSRSLIAICGDKQTPCNLNININVGYCNSVQEDLFEVETLIKNIKNEIIYDKNNAMFGYILKEKALKNFESFKNSISEYTDRLKLNVEQYDFIINNKNIKDDINKTEFELNLYIEQIKDLIKDFNKTNNTQLVVDAIELYQNTLRPKLNDLMSLKYKHTFVEFNEKSKMYQLFQLPNSIETFERCYGNPKIISFKYNKGLNALIDNSNKEPKNKNTKLKETKLKETKPKEKKTKIVTQKIKPIKEPKTKTLKQKQSIMPIVEKDNTLLINDIFGEDSDSSSSSSDSDEEDLNSDILKETEHTNSDF